MSCDCADRCGCACRRRAEDTPRRVLTFLTSSTFVDCCFAVTFLVAGIAYGKPVDIFTALWDGPQIYQSIEENFEECADGCWLCISGCAEYVRLKACEGFYTIRHRFQA